MLIFKSKLTFVFIQSKASFSFNSCTTLNGKKRTQPTLTNYFAKKSKYLSEENSDENSYLETCDQPDSVCESGTPSAQ